MNLVIEGSYTGQIFIADRQLTKRLYDTDTIKIVTINELVTSMVFL